MTSFDGLYAEAAWAVANHGFTIDEWGEVGAAGDWNALVTISPTVLLNLGEDDLAARLEERIGDGERDVHVRQLNDGQVVTKESVPTDFPGEADRIRALFDKDKESHA